MSPRMQLRQAREALARGEPLRCAEALAAFEAAIAREPPDAAEAAALQAALAQLSRLVQAALAGVAEARRQFLLAIDEAHSLDVYDSEGRRGRVSLRPPASHRY